MGFMRPLNILIYGAVSIMLLVPVPVASCTVFVLSCGDTIVAGKNLDWPVGDGFIVANPSGMYKVAMVRPGREPVRWISRYASITFNQFGTGFPLGGMNEQGLVVEEVSYGPSVYSSEDERPVINEMQWIQLQLDKYTSVKEVIQAVKDVRIEKYLFGIHYLICDRSGDAAVIEFIDGKMKVFTGSELPVRVLSNNTYENSLRYLNRHQGFGGKIAVQHLTGSQERFLWAAGLIKNYRRIRNRSLAAYGHTILDDVRQADTRWSILYQPSAMAIAFEIPGKHPQTCLRFGEVDFSSLRIHPLSVPDQDSSHTINFVPAAAETDQELLQLVLRELVRYEAVDRVKAENIRCEMQQYRMACEYPNY